MQDQNTVTLESKVAKFKLIARNALRMNLISPRLSKISDLEGGIKATEECQKAHEHQMLVINYEISKMDTNHPDYEEMKKDELETLKAIEEVIKSHVEEIAELNKLITTEKEGIAKIESGETKVCLDDLNDLTAKLIKQDALNQVTI